MKLAKNQANAKQHPEVQFWLFKNYSHYSSRSSSKNNRTYLKIRKVQVCLYSRDYAINHNKNEDEKER